MISNVNKEYVFYSELRTKRYKSAVQMDKQFKFEKNIRFFRLLCCRVRNWASFGTKPNSEQVSAQN